ncbi:MAG: ATP-grasp domain-containing protein [Pseudonocardiales bacterium]|nr:ATP-grasp domain-containing protein [Pseudonocardiales bacterium]
MAVNVFVLGLDEHNEQILRDIPDAAQYRFHPLLSRDELFGGEQIPLRYLLDKGTTQLKEFEGSIDAIIGFWDFPVSSMVPILCHRLGVLRCASLEAVVKCEHKYWSRLEQQKVIKEYPRFGLVDPERDTDPPHGVSYPMWIKPVKSASSELAFGVANHQEFQDALAQIRGGIAWMGAPFEIVLDHLNLPPDIASVGGQVCLAEETISGRQLTFEGYRYRGKTYTLGVVDSVGYDDSPSFLRYQYPAAIPDRTAKRMAEISDRIVGQVRLEHTTFNIEFFWNENTDALSVLEINPRHSQSHAELFTQVDGAPNHLAMLHLALDRDPQLPHRQGPYRVAAKWFVRRWHDGIIRRHPTELEITQLQHNIPGVTVEVIARTGDRLSELIGQDSYSYIIANIYIGAQDETELTDKYQRCLRALPFEIDDHKMPTT